MSGVASPQLATLYNESSTGSIHSQLHHTWIDTIYLFSNLRGLAFTLDKIYTTVTAVACNSRPEEARNRNQRERINRLLQYSHEVFDAKIVTYFVDSFASRMSVIDTVANTTKPEILLLVLCPSQFLNF